VQVTNSRRAPSTAISRPSPSVTGAAQPFRLGVLCPMPSELRPVVRRLALRRSPKQAGRSLHSGTVGDVEITATIRRPLGDSFDGIVVVGVALAVAGSLVISWGSSSVSTRPLSGAATLEQAQTAGIDVGGVIETVQQFWRAIAEQLNQSWVELRAAVPARDRPGCLDTAAAVEDRVGDVEPAAGQCHRFHDARYPVMAFLAHKEMEQQPYHQAAGCRHQQDGPAAQVAKRAPQPAIGRQLGQVDQPLKQPDAQPGQHTQHQAGAAE